MSQDKIYLDIQLDDKQYASKIEALKKSIKESQAAFQRTKLEVARLKEEMAKAGGGTAEMKAKMTALKQTLLSNKVAIEANKSALADFNAVSKKTGGIFGEMGASLKKMVAGFIGVYGFYRIVDGLKESYRAAEEADKIHRKLAQTIDATGGAAGLTVEELRKMATSLQKLTGISDEEIKNAENLLLTFKNIGGDVFPRVTRAVLDMSEAMGQDLKSSAVQIGKALNDPILGLTALSRVGVTFTDAQKEMIKQMVKTGEVAKAQKIILQELESEFGGAAEAGKTASKEYASAVSDLQESIGNLSQTIGVDFVGDMADAISEMNIFVEKINDAIAASDDLRLMLSAVFNGGYFKYKDAQKNLEFLNKVSAGDVGANLQYRLTNPFGDVTKDMEKNVNVIKDYLSNLDKLKKRLTPSGATGNGDNGIENNKTGNGKTKSLVQEGKFMSDEEGLQAEQKDLDKRLRALDLNLREQLSMYRLEKLQELKITQETEYKKLAEIEKTFGKQSDQYRNQLIVIRENNKQIMDIIDKSNQKAAEKAKQNAEDTAYEIQAVYDELSRTISDSLNNVIDGTETFGDAFKNIMHQISNNAIEELVSIGIKGLGGLGTSNNTSSSSSSIINSIISLFSGALGGLGGGTTGFAPGGGTGSGDDIMLEILKSRVGSSYSGTPTDKNMAEILTEVQEIKELLSEANDISSNRTAEEKLGDEAMRKVLEKLGVDNKATLDYLVKLLAGQTTTSLAFTGTTNTSGLGRFLDMLPHFDTGGIIPGAYMQPMIAKVHGGEEVLRPDNPRHSRNSGGSGGEMTYIYAPQVRTEASSEAVLSALDKHSREFYAKVSEGISNDSGLRNTVRNTR